MCGLSGAAGDLTTKEEKAFKDMVIVSQLRGTDSTGIGAVSRTLINGQHEIKVAKDVGPPWYLWDTKTFDKCFYGSNMVFIGHNRSKTIGEANRKNAHPFLIGDVLGAHNGTIDYVNKNRMEDGSDFKTDSEAIFNNIAVHGLEDTISRIEPTEAYALTYFDRRDRTINFVRNDQRPLWYTYDEKHRCLFWASELGFLLACLHRNGIEASTGTKGYVPEENVWHKWVVPNISFSEIGKPETKKLKNYTKVIYQSAFGKKNQSGNTDEKSGSTVSEINPQTTLIWDNARKEYIDNDSLTYGDYDPKYGDYGVPGYSCAVKPQDSIGVGKSFTEQTKELIKNGISSLIDIIDMKPEDEIKDEKNVVKETLVKETKIIPGTAMTAEDVFRKRKYEDMKKNGMIPLENYPMVYKGKDTTGVDVVVHLDRDKGVWNTYRYNPARYEWDNHRSPMIPDCIPYHILDVETGGSHKFKHEGSAKKRNKRILYKGFHGDLIPQEGFNKFMEGGCLSCDRHPTWGNEVLFLDHEGNFFCEYCSMVPSIVNDFKGNMKKRQEKAA